MSKGSLLGMVALVASLVAACGADVVVGAIDPSAGDAPDAVEDAAAPDGAPGEPTGDAGGATRDAATYTPCDGKACGARCTLCDPRDAACAETAVLKYCDGEGRCGASAPVCGAGDGGSAYDPCAAKQCGASCRVCAPGDLGCVETAVLKECDRAGKCVPGFADCGAIDAGPP